MRYGFVVPWADADAIGDLAATAEASGWDGLFVWEPVWGVDAWICLALAATRTSSIRLGTMLTPPSRRRPWELASQVATVDRLSERARHAVGRPRSDRQRLRHVRRGDRSAGPRRAARRMPRHRHRAVGRATVQLRRARTTTCSRPSSRRSARRCNNHGCRSGASACSAGQKSMARALRWDGLLPQQAGGKHPTLAEIACDPRVARRSRLRHRHRGRGQPALAGGLGGGRGDVVDRVDVGRRQRDRRRLGRQRPPPPRPAALIPSAIVATPAQHDCAERRRQTGAVTGGGTTPRSGRRSLDRLPDAPAQRHAGRIVDVAASSTSGPTPSPLTSSSRGVVEQDKVAQYLYNGPEYLESVFAAFKAGLAVVNTNYRYTPDELTYLWDNADVVAVVFHGAFVDQCASGPPVDCRASTRGCGSTTAPGPARPGRRRTKR